ncbi:MAG: NYN domain-containing protein [Treponemataceae bacterium]|nr:NYN domain-containing protein [Treponemataceae bacterium]
MDNISRALLVMDGNYVRKWETHLSEDGIEGNLCSIRFDSLINYVATVIGKDFGCRCVFTAKKLYMGTNADVDAQNQHFYRMLDDAGIQRHTFPLRMQDERTGRVALKEEACDTAIVFNTAKEFYSASRENRFDTLVLFAGDGDLTPLAEGLHAEGVKVVIVYYDFKTPLSVTRASQKLLESADKVINFGALLTERVDKNILAIFADAEKPAAPQRKRLVLSLAKDRGTKSAPLYAAYTRSEIIGAIQSLPQRDKDGYVLVAQLGKYLEAKTGKLLPPGTKLKTILEQHTADLETKELPAYSVRIVPSRQ